MLGSSKAKRKYMCRKGNKIFNHFHIHSSITEFGEANSNYVLGSPKVVPADQEAIDMD